MVHTAKASVIGSYVTDLAFKAETLPEVGETRIAHDFKMGPGGKGFNQAVACRRLDIDTLFIGAVGDDPYQQLVRDFAKAEGLITELEVHQDSYTGAASIGVDAEGRNQIAVALGANDRLSSSHVEQFRSVIRDARVVVCQLECNMGATQKALEIAREEGVVAVLNPAPINEQFTPDLLELADVITPNESEFRYMVEKVLGTQLDSDYWTRGAADLHDLCIDMKVPTVVLTLGEHGAFISHNPDIASARRDSPYEITDSKPYYQVQALKVKPLDTTGAGDAFNGGLAAGLIHHPDSFAGAINLATGTAALSVTKAGTAPSMPFLHEVRKFLDTQSHARGSD